MSSILVIYVLAFVVISYCYVHSILVPRPFPNIPYNKISRFLPVGDLILLGLYNLSTGEVFSWFSLQCVKHKSPMTQIFMPSISTTHPVIIMADVREIEDVATKRVQEIDRADIMHAWFGLLTPKATVGLKTRDIEFMTQRRLWNTMLSPQFLNEVMGVTFHKAAVKLADLWEEQAQLAGNDCAFQMMEDIKMVTLEGIWKAILGSEFSLLDARVKSVKSFGVIRKSKAVATFNKGEMPDFYTTLETLQMCLGWTMQGISPRFYTWVFRSTGVLPRAEKKKDQVLDHCITTARERLRKHTQSDKLDFTCGLDQVLQKEASLNKRVELNGISISNSALKDEILELLIAGHETTASSICWALKYLTDHPLAQTQLRNSLYSAIPDASPSNLPSAKRLLAASLPYLDAVIAENLRLSATGPVSFRQTLTECELLGHAIPAGTPLILITAGPSYNDPNMAPPSQLSSDSVPCSDFYPYPSIPSNPNHHPTPSLHHTEFNPSRWLIKGVFDPNAVSMFPFSAGPRGCFGKKIAMLELRIVLAVLIMRFQFPRLSPELSRYGAKDGLTRRPTCCHVRPMLVETR
ncbi:cytochrome P450 [Dothidotthia symphoricarpi CBS 119687]|uniref:Cytochrome P450 n=1 Tax=Dothidotthia symphoricarpi CBS 119687 TaxID=1392245 RepID=A0A6A6ACM7_9PLEO|nr:cytochrome P450 [Dothidotthia symphoricarpi CBS 119687]KAF2128875.1 cytochrome P450 [Dothidotthia symphoricarpi CBS 119687]